MIEWTAEMNELLINLIEEEGLTYAQAAVKMTETFEVEFTKNSLVGRGRKLGIPPRSARTEMVMMEAPPLIIPDEPPHIEGEPVTIYQLRNGMCKWPLREPLGARRNDCGCRVNDVGGSWCSEHRKIVYGKATYDTANDHRE
jgi:hypothetical protein